MTILAFQGSPTASAQDLGKPVERIAEPVEDTAPIDPADSAEEGDPAGPRSSTPFDVDIFGGGGGSASELVHVPVTTLYPGDVKVDVPIVNPMDDPAAVQRGMQYYNQFNCVGCHAPNGAGGMGPSLSNHVWIYGSEPENIYLSILQGRPAGMPVWGGMLPDQVIWDLVAYIKSISRESKAPWGRTVSADGFTIEQVPAEFLQTADPWAYTTPFSYGQAPFEKPEGSPPKETPGDGEPPE
ncbi:cytochrome c [Aurantimonas sp. HBX-1]|uniref:c-type cytochrome n=1 Tax=Aurantimonas sp. HBX-1 TaxID=2906072 RepID=UPI001F41DBFC|nr:cytochrome c [Aurantimonas sp. HBX-1]UIJ71014.1 cytochrome c [Aurantimonas sp. HBX-1]